MELAERLAVFETELNYIKTTEIRAFVEQCIQELPEYFFTIAASASGKYHPSYALGEGGLVRHTKAAVRIFKMFMDAGMGEFYPCSSLALLNTTTATDCGVAALILHDGWKRQQTDLDQTAHEHPLVAARNVRAVSIKNPYIGDYLYPIVCAIETHMGKWCTSQHSSIVLPTPYQGSWLDKLVHMADYLASRKSLEYKFEVEVK